MSSDSTKRIVNRRGTLALDAESGYGSVEATQKPETPAASRLLRRLTFSEGEQQFKSKLSTWTIDEDESTMGDTSIVINLLADLSPAGTLPLAYGMSGTGYVPAICMLILFASAAAYMMYLISRTIEISGAKSYDRIWEKCVGSRSAWVPTFVLLCVCFGNCMAYACMFGDLFSGCMPGFGLSFFTRTNSILVLSAFPLLPLCMLKDLSMLAPTSFAALLAVCWMCIMMITRLFDGSYLPGGQFHGAPKETGHTWNIGISSLLLVNDLAVAFLCHYNGCKYYREFIDHRPNKFVTRVGTAFGAVSSIFAVTMTVGYATFGSKAEGVILNNYNEKDNLANVARLGMAMANVFSFPLMFSGLREAALALLTFVAPGSTETFALVYFQNGLSAAMLAVITVLAVIVTDAGIVIGLVGAICGSAIIYVVPCFLFDAASHKFLAQGEKQANPKEIMLVRAIGCTGVVLMGAGAAASLLL
eukprot:TRINITY_DN20600_c0_g1_i1.p1 TRINITY_DN20600_c0_g1~~TRINITY_DN20600_c0_g1_i1.p1  ORF type:complete len:474 (+),score=88.49 TRINITY_DN20600_c0_g1_i1:125-1546(+)